MRKPSKSNPPCPFCSNHPTTKIGFKKNKKRNLQRFKCNKCSKTFMIQPEIQKSKTYTIKTILDTISSYNLGKSLRQLEIPKSTIHNWLKTINLPMNRLRKRIKQNPIIKKQFIHHQQPFLYQYHQIKLSFANRYPRLTYYLKNLEELLPKDIFKNSKRISEISKETTTKGGDRPGVAPVGVVGRTFFEEKWPSPAIGLVGVSDKIITKQNYAVELAKLAASITNDNRRAHQIIENFMLINDTATIAVEIPVFLKSGNQALTGHIDILQIRFNKLYILDYKPEPYSRQQAVAQLNLYRKALSSLINIPEHKINTAFFNENGYYEID